MVLAASNGSVWTVLTGVGVIVSLLLGLRALGLLGRVKHIVMGGYQPHWDVARLPARPRFVLRFENRGLRSVGFYDFEVLDPYLDADAIRADGTFNLRAGGAAFFYDGESRQSLPYAQAFRAIEHRSLRVLLQPQEAVTEFFELDAFGKRDAQFGLVWRHDFQPLLTFRDTFGNEFHADAGGVHHGPYLYPHQRELDAALPLGPGRRVTTTRLVGLLPFFWLRRWSSWDSDPLHHRYPVSRPTLGERWRELRSKGHSGQPQGQ